MNWCFIACPTKDCASMIHLSFYILFSHPKKIIPFLVMHVLFIVIIFPWYMSNCSHISIFQLDVRYTLMNNWFYMPITTFSQGIMKGMTCWSMDIMKWIFLSLNCGGMKQYFVSKRSSSLICYFLGTYQCFMSIYYTLFTSL
jgi:hypothetical protein